MAKLADVPPFTGAANTALTPMLHICVPLHLLLCQDLQWIAVALALLGVEAALLQRVQAAFHSAPNDKQVQAVQRALEEAKDNMVVSSSEVLHGACAGQQPPSHAVRTA